MYKLPERGGGGCKLGNAWKKTFFFKGGVPLASFHDLRTQIVFEIYALFPHFGLGSRLRKLFRFLDVLLQKSPESGCKQVEVSWFSVDGKASTPELRKTNLSSIRWVQALAPARLLLSPLL